MPRDAQGRFIPDPANNKGRDRATSRKLWAAREQLHLSQYEGRYCYHVDEILAVLPGTARDVANRLDMPYSCVWSRLQTLYDCEWVHIGDTKEHPAGGPDMPVYFAGNGEDIKENESKYIIPSKPIKLDPSRKANPFDALLGYGT